MNCKWQIWDPPTSYYYCRKSYPYKRCTYESSCDVPFCPDNEAEDGTR